MLKFDHSAVLEPCCGHKQSALHDLVQSLEISGDQRDVHASDGIGKASSTNMHRMASGRHREGPHRILKIREFDDPTSGGIGKASGNF